MVLCIKLAQVLSSSYGGLLRLGAALSLELLRSEDSLAGFLRRLFRGWNLLLPFSGVSLCLRVARGAGGASQMRVIKSVRGASTWVVQTTHARGNHAGRKASSCRPPMFLLRALATWWRRYGMDLQCGRKTRTAWPWFSCNFCMIHFLYPLGAVSWLHDNPPRGPIWCLLQFFFLYILQYFSIYSTTFLYIFYSIFLYILLYFIYIL